MAATGPTLALVTDLAGELDQERTRVAALQIAEEADPTQIADLVGLLSDRDKSIRRVTGYMVGGIADPRPDLFLPHVPALIAVTKIGTGPAVWEAQYVLSAVAALDPPALAPYLETIAESFDGDSVIARDNAVRILARLATLEDTRPAAMRALCHALRTAPVNQLPMYAEKVAPVVRPEDSDIIRSILTDRLSEISQSAKIRRIESVLRKLPDQ